MNKYTKSAQKIFRYSSYVFLSAIIALFAFMGVHKKDSGLYTFDFDAVNKCHADIPLPSFGDAGDSGDGDDGGDGDDDSC